MIKQRGRLNVLVGNDVRPDEPPPPRTTIGPWEQSYCRVLGGRVFLWARYPCTLEATSVLTSQRALESEAPLCGMVIMLVSFSDVLTSHAVPRTYVAPERTLLALTRELGLNEQRKL